MTQRNITNIKTIPFRGGCKTAIEPELLELGDYSMIQNLRQMHPGMEARKGQIALHSTADGTNRVISLHQFVKGKKTERHFYAQMSDSDVLEASSDPPTVTVGAFGSEVFSGSASPVAASWANNNDLMLFANGVDLPQIYPGTDYVWKFIVYKGTSAIPVVPELGDDYTQEVTDGSTTTYAPLDSLGDLAVDFDCLFVLTPVPINTLTWVVKSANGTASVAAANYWNGTEFTAVSDFADGTSASSKAFAQDGSMTWTLPTAHVPNYMFGVCGFWTQIYLSSGDLDSETEVSSVTFATTWQSIQNVWDGVPVSIVEAQLYDSSNATYSTYSADIDLGGADSNGDLLYLACTDPSCGFYVDVGDTPAKCQSIATVKYWNGSSFAACSSISDGTSGLSKSGWITFARQTDMQTYRFNGSVEAYWYQITIPQQSAVVCLNFDGDDAATTFTDLSGKTWTAAADAQLDTAQKKYGTASLLCDGTGDYIYTPAHDDFDFGTGDFTVEWFGRVASSGHHYPISLYVDADNWFYVDANINTGATSTITVSNRIAGTTTITYGSGNFTTAADTWYHFAVIRKNGTIQSFVDGVAKASLVATATIFYDGATAYRVGNNSASYQLGWMDDLRISKTAVYALGANFTPPASALGLAVAGAVASGTTVGVDSEPYFDVTEMGKGQTVCSWQGRAVYGTATDQYLYLASDDNPQVLNGDNYAMLEPGDGRNNRPVALRLLKDDLMCWQEEKGKAGGCITRFTWNTSLDDVSKVLVSSTLGAMNANCVEVIEGIEAPLNRDQPIMTLGFFLSRQGVFITDGNTVYGVDNDIRNYFDPSKAECIRRGYEDKMWIAYDSGKRVIRLGLVSGANATVPNVFPVLDIQDKTWSFDVFGQEISCMTEAEAASGDIPVLQIGGGVDDGTVYLMNYGTTDVSSVIDSYATMEIDGKGEVIHISEFVLRLKDDSGYGGAVVTPYEDGTPMSPITVDI